MGFPTTWKSDGRVREGKPSRTWVPLECSVYDVCIGYCIPYRPPETCVCEYMAISVCASLPVESKLVYTPRVRYVARLSDTVSTCTGLLKPVYASAWQYRCAQAFRSRVNWSLRGSVRMCERRYWMHPILCGPPETCVRKCMAISICASVPVESKLVRNEG